MIDSILYRKPSNQLETLNSNPKLLAMPEQAIEEYRVAEEPYYLAVNREIDLFEAAHAAHLPVILKGPTGCGKTRFVEHMAWRLERPLITVACHEDLSSTDLVGRFLIEGEETV